MMPNNKPKHTPLTVPQARRILGMIAKNYSDEELAEILEIQRGWAELAYSVYLDKLDEVPIEKNEFNIIDE